MIGLQIETPETIENADEIVSTEEADLIFLGPVDLSLNFGFPGRAQHPEVIETITELTKEVRAAGVSGSGSPGTGFLARHFRAGTARPLERFRGCLRAAGAPARCGQRAIPSRSPRRR